MNKEIIFRGRKITDGQWIEGNYFHNKRKGESHNIVEKETNDWYEIYRESLQVLNNEDKFENV